LGRWAQPTWSISLMPISRGCFKPAERALLTFRIFSEPDSSWTCERSGVCGAEFSPASDAAPLDPRYARCSFNRSWRRAEEGLTKDEDPVSGVPVPGSTVSHPWPSGDKIAKLGLTALPRGCSSNWRLTGGRLVSQP